MGGPASSTTAENYMQAQEQTAISTALHPPNVWESFADGTSKIFSITSTIFIKTLSLLWRKKVMEN